MTSVLQLQFHNKLLGLAIVWWQPFALFCLLTILMMSLFGLLAIWAGLGRGHWFLRAAVVLGCISLLLVIPAFELVTVYVIQAGLTVVALGAWRNWRLARCAVAVVVQPSRLHCAGETPAPQVAETGQRSPWQFSILDLLLLTALAAWVCAMLTSAPPAAWAGWPALLAEGVIMAALSVGMAWIALSDGRRWVRLPLFFILFPAALMAAWLELWQWARPASTTVRRNSWQTGLSRAGLVLVSLAILAPAAAVVWRLAHPRTAPELIPPSPNGYDDLVRAGALIENVNVPDFDTATRATESVCCPVRRGVCSGASGA